jgi:hypothetical protein
MSSLRNRLSKLETKAKPDGGVIVTSYLDSRDDERRAEAKRQAEEQGAILIVLKRFSDPVTGEFIDCKVPGVDA